MPAFYPNPLNVLTSIPAPAGDLPQGFCYAHDVIDDLILDIRYAGNHNFVGRPVDGYEAPYAVMTKQAAQALKAVADDLRPQGLRLMIYDAYRPMRAVRHFVRWSQDAADLCMQREFYPRFKSKAEIIEQGYISPTSSHCRGSVVDLTLADAQGNPLDMGGCFDYFGALSWHDSPLVTPQQTENREQLRAAMKRRGFDDYSKEWWHYRLLSEPFSESFDFPVR